MLFLFAVYEFITLSMLCFRDLSTDAERIFIAQKRIRGAVSLQTRVPYIDCFTELDVMTVPSL